MTIREDAATEQERKRRVASNAIAEIKRRMSLSKPAETRIKREPPKASTEDEDFARRYKEAKEYFQ